MPTDRHRLTITETPMIEERLNRAAKRFPELAGRRRELLLKLTELGERFLEVSLGDDDPRERAKQRVIARTAEITPTEADAMILARETEWGHEIDW